jgi:predicted nucleotide-binding protein (sugar kinase/HSP70/actin superfamily)
MDSSGIGYKIYYVHMHIINLKNKNVKNSFAPAVYLPFRTVKINHED